MDMRWLHPWSTELAHVQLDLLCAWQAAQLDQLGQQPQAARPWFSKPTGICSSMHSLMTEIVNCAMALPCSTALCSLGPNPGRPHRSSFDLRALGMRPPTFPRRARDQDEQSVPSQTPHTFVARRAAMITACNWASQRSNPSLMSSPRLVSPAVPTAAQRPATPQNSSRKNWVPAGGEHPSEP